MAKKQSRSKIIKASKNWLRLYLMNQRKSMSQNQRTIHSRKVKQILQRSPLLKSAKVVAIYISFGSEVQTWPLIKWCWKKGKQVVIPMVDRGFEKPYFSLFEKGDRLIKSKFGPRELQDIKPAFPFKKIKLVLTPGLGFDEFGYRIGFGAGVYDRLIPKTKNAKHVGLFFENQGLFRIPFEPHDHQLEFICTENRLRKI